MGFEAQSATGVPPLQRRNFAVICRRMWAVGRTLRGSLTTANRARSSRLAWASLLLLTAFTTRTAHAEPPSDPPAPVSAATPAAEGWARRLARSHFERGVELERRGDIAAALREYTETLAIDGTLGEAYLRLGSLRERMGDAREAELVYSEAIRLGDTRARALLQRSHLMRAAGRSAQALLDLEASVELEVTREALAELAHHYVEAHAWSAALETFRRIASSAQTSDDSAALETARLEVRALRVLAAETDPTTEPVKRHDWVGRALISIARR